MRFRASSAGLGLTLLCGTIVFSGCASDSGGGNRAGGSASSGGSAGSATAGSAGSATAGSSSSGATGGSGGAGASGGSGGTGATVTPVCPTPMTLDNAMISAFEGAEPSFGADGEFGGGYYAYADLEKGGTTTPDTSAPGTELVPATGSYEGNGLHYAGTGFAADSWGAGFGVWITCADASTVEGIAFWVKNDQPLRVAATIPGTQDVTSGGECAASCTPNSFTVVPHDEWTLVEIPWSQFAGGTVPFTPSKLLGIDILVPKPEPEAGAWSFDVSLDNLSFMSDELPMGDGAGGANADGANAGGANAGGGAGGAG